MLTPDASLCSVAQFTRFLAARISGCFSVVEEKSKAESRRVLMCQKCV